jgi:hypothetical protein
MYGVRCTEHTISCVVCTRHPFQQALTRTLHTPIHTRAHTHNPQHRQRPAQAMRGRSRGRRRTSSGCGSPLRVLTRPKGRIKTGTWWVCFLSRICVASFTTFSPSISLVFHVSLAFTNDPRQHRHHSTTATFANIPSPVLLSRSTAPPVPLPKPLPCHAAHHICLIRFIHSLIAPNKGHEEPRIHGPALLVPPPLHSLRRGGL